MQAKITLSNDEHIIDEARVSEQLIQEGQNYEPALVVTFLDSELKVEDLNEIFSRESIVKVTVLSDGVEIKTFDEYTDLDIGRLQKQYLDSGTILTLAIKPTKQ